MTHALGLHIVRFTAAPGLLAAFTAGCFIFGRSKPAPESPVNAPEGEIALNVVNHNYLDVVIYVLHHGVRTRVGSVTGSTSTVFLLPARLLGQGREIQLRGIRSAPRTRRSAARTMRSPKSSWCSRASTSSGRSRLICAARASPCISGRLLGRWAVHGALRGAAAREREGHRGHRDARHAYAREQDGPGLREPAHIHGRDVGHRDGHRFPRPHMAVAAPRLH